MSAVERIKLRGSGLNLVADAAGPADGQVILFLHGSGQTRQSWDGALAQSARRGYRGIAPDMRGHGDSDWSPDGEYSVERFADDAAAIVAQLGGKPVLVGASLGGLAGIQLAAAAPDALRALVLVDITPRIEMKGAREVMAFMDSAPKGFASLDAAADAVAAYLPHRQRPQSSSGLLRNLRLRDGRYHWHWDPAFMKMGRDADARMNSDEPNRLEVAARKIRVPTLLIRGGRSRIVSDDSAREFLQMVPQARMVDIAKADHMVAGDANDAFSDAVFSFIDELCGSSPHSRSAA